MTSTTTHPAATYGPIDTAPDSLPEGATFQGALLRALDGVQLGAYDRRIIDWLAGWDVPTVATVVSLLHRARTAAATELESKLNDTYYDMDVIRTDRDELQASLHNLQGGDR